MSMTQGLQFAESPRLRFSRWTATAMFVVAVHAGTALALMRWQDEETSDSPGSIAIELAPIMAASALKSQDVAPGPLMEEATPTPEATKRPQQEVVEETPSCRAITASPRA